MIDISIGTINKQAAEEQQGIKFANINMKTIVTDYKERGNDSDSDVEDSNKLYKTSGDSTVGRDKDLTDEPDQPEENQQQHFNVTEINNIDDDNSSNKNKGVGGEGVGEEDDPIQDNKKTVHIIGDEDVTGEEDNASVYADDPSIETVDDDNDEETRVSNKQPTEPEEPVPPRPPTV